MSASSTRRLAASVLAAGAIVSAAALPAMAHDRDEDRQQRRSGVEISAVQANSPGPDTRSNRSLNREWIEITNSHRRAVNLDGWTLRDRDGNRYRFHDVRLAGRATVRIHTGVGRDTRTDLYMDRRHYMWDNHADTATLRNDRGHTVDTESWGRGGHHRG
ncbi:lamin tail domain-containing protein [Streptomyces albidochromogenes]|uniref:lamin tail domain-containing protein n=1 Tax=Streptomyces albidochromogenes TaxID=329524 RepID=UPI00110FC899|nr:lamin tail domain-containing protein [Streptomyces albidochromogenes]